VTTSYESIIIDKLAKTPKTIIMGYRRRTPGLGSNPEKTCMLLDAHLRGKDVE